MGNGKSQEILITRPAIVRGTYETGYWLRSLEDEPQMKELYDSGIHRVTNGPFYGFRGRMETVEYLFIRPEDKYSVKTGMIRHDLYVDGKPAYPSSVDVNRKTLESIGTLVPPSQLPPPPVIRNINVRSNVCIIDGTIFTPDQAVAFMAERKINYKPVLKMIRTVKLEMPDGKVYTCSNIHVGANEKYSIGIINDNLMNVHLYQGSTCIGDGLKCTMQTLEDLVTQKLKSNA
jgi:hypothetical protein